MVKKRSHGEGTLYYDEKNDRWVAQVSLPNGKRRTKSGKDKKKLLDWLTEQRSKIKRGTFVTDNKIKLGDYLDRYMEDIAKHNLRPRTYETHAGYIRNHIKPELGHIRLVSLRPDQVQAFYTKKLNEGLAKRTVEYMHAILHKTLDQALRWGLVARNVTDLVDPPRPKRKPPTIWSAEEIQTFLESVEGHQYYPIYIVAVYTGMRQGEILGIHKEDVDLERGVINVKNQLQPIKGKGLTVTRVKSDKSQRPITLPETALNVLRQHLETVDKGLIFTTSKGKPIWAQTLYHHFKDTIEKLGLPDVNFHSLRHAHASLLLQAGTNPKVVQERLGHSSVLLTLDTYSHVVPSLQEEAAEKFEEMI